MAGRLPDPCRGPSPRREVLRIGGLGALGVGLGAIARPLRAADSAVPAAKPRARNCIVLFLAGGPPQHETFDPKPAAPIEIRGPFLPVSTSVPGVAFCELLPRLARRADRLCVIRSMTTGIHSHSTSGCFMLTGHEPASVAENVPASAADWPSIAAAVGALRPADQGPLDAVVIPEPLVNNPAIPWPGQNGGFMGATWHPHLLRCDPAAARLEIDGLSVPAEAVRRLGARRGLLESLDGLAIPGSQGLLEAARVRSEAFDLLSAGATRRALEIERETEPTRDRYGRTKFGQSVLLARRLVEAGVRLVQVNYPREPGDTTSNNPLWDTHVDNAGRLERVLCPTFDMALAALLDDLAERGLLDDTLVVAMGEFGRTPRINPAGGRDHWGSVFSVALAGAGIPGGAVIGASDAHGAQPTLRPVRPPDLAATIFQLLGIAPATEFRDGLGRPLALVSGGEALTELVGSQAVDTQPAAPQG